MNISGLFKGYEKHLLVEDIVKSQRIEYCLAIELFPLFFSLEDNSNIDDVSAMVTALI